MVLWRNDPKKLANAPSRTTLSAATLVLQVDLCVRSMCLHASRVPRPSQLQTIHFSICIHTRLILVIWAHELLFLTAHLIATQWFHACSIACITLDYNLIQARIFVDVRVAPDPNLLHQFLWWLSSHASNYPYSTQSFLAKQNPKKKKKSYHVSNSFQFQQCYMSYSQYFGWIQL